MNTTAATALDNHIASAVCEGCAITPTEGNAVVVLQNGPITFPAMLEDIARAKYTVNFENFKIHSDVTGWEFANALAERARAGVRVKLLYDAFGSSAASADLWSFLQSSGVDVRVFHPLSDGPAKAMVRDHRKLMIVDGRVSYIGGHCIGDEWAGRIPKEPAWRDTHCRIEGPASAVLQRSFCDLWEESGAERFDETDICYYPHLEPVGTVSVAVLPCGTERMMKEAYLQVMDAARRRIMITNAYFYPDQELVTALKAAAARGVEVQIITPSKSDVDVVIPASRSMYDDLLSNGVQIFEYQPAILHAKTAIVDDCWATIGSCNLDNLSLNNNYEANVALTDPAVIAELIDDFRHDLDRSERIVLHRWRRRPVVQRLTESLASLIGPRL